MTAKGKSRKTKIADRFLAKMRDGKFTASLYLVSGYQLKGEVLEFDDEAVLFSHRGTPQIVMRAAVSTMYPLPGSGRDLNGWWAEYAPAAVGEETD